MSQAILSAFLGLRGKKFLSSGDYSIVIKTSILLFQNFMIYSFKIYIMEETKQQLLDLNPGASI